MHHVFQIKNACFACSQNKLFGGLVVPEFDRGLPFLSIEVM